MTSSTLIPIGMIITLLGSIVSYGELKEKVSQHDKAIASIQRIERRLIRLEVKLGVDKRIIEPLDEE